MASIDIDIEDYIDEIDDDCLISEMITRKKYSKDFAEKIKGKKLIEEFDTEEIIDALVFDLRLSIIQESELKEFIKTLK